MQEQDFRGEILPPSIDIGRDLITIDLRTEAVIDGIVGAFGHMFAPEGRFLRIILTPSLTKDAVMEVIVPEAALKDGADRLLAHDLADRLAGRLGRRRRGWSISRSIASSCGRCGG